MSKRNGTLRKPTPSRLASMRVALLSAISSMEPLVVAVLLVALVVLGGCATTGSTVTATRTICAPWRAITYSGKGDTAPTKEQIRVHNRTGENLKCW